MAETRAAVAVAAAAALAAADRGGIPSPPIGGGNDSTAWTGGPNKVASQEADKTQLYYGQKTNCF
jgi:hypothetical protein